MVADFPAERRFWFEPTFHPGQSALLHKQPDNIYRIDLQLGWDADPEVERQPEVVMPRIAKVVGHSDFRLNWVSVYTFQCRRLAKFVHDQVIFVGDSAHVVSPFGARGGNGGLQDVDNLGWKLAAVLRGDAGNGLLDSYDRERTFGADENITNSTRATKFMTPSDGVERLFRDQILRLAGKAAFARPMVNSGRLSHPCVYPCPAAPDDQRLPKISMPGSVAPDAPLENGWLIDALGQAVIIMAVGTVAPAVAGTKTLTLAVTDKLQARYLGQVDQAVYLIRPDQVVAARWVDPSEDDITAAIRQIWNGEL
jgi:3-(3-hydroxy-phenyl)propionate hydroxylase